MGISEALTATPAYMWVLIVGAVAGWVTIYPLYRKKLTVMHERGKEVGLREAHLSTMEESLKDGSKRMECLQKSIDGLQTNFQELHNDHGKVTQRLEAIEGIIKQRNGFEQRLMDRIEKALTK